MTEIEKASLEEGDLLVYCGELPSEDNSEENYVMKFVSHKDNHSFIGEVVKSLHKKSWLGNKGGYLYDAFKKKTSIKFTDLLSALDKLEEKLKL